MRVGLLMMLEFAGKRVQRIGLLRAWGESIANEIRRWPRTADNDPYQFAVEAIAADLSVRLGYPVLAGYNEFCAPTVGEAIDQVISNGARRVVVVPTMLVRGNSHTELEIQEAVIQASRCHRTIRIHYAWPFEQARLVSLLADQVVKHLELHLR